MESTIISLWIDYLRASSLLIKTIGGTNIVGEMAERIVVDYYGSSSFDVEFMKPLRPESGPQSGRPW